MRLYAARTDANQPQIVRDIREVFGPDCLVDTSRVGGGFPDLVLGVRGRTILLEIKGAKGKLTPDQVYFHRNWPGQVGVARTIEEALAIVERETT